MRHLHGKITREVLNTSVHNACANQEGKTTEAHKFQGIIEMLRASTKESWMRKTFLTGRRNHQHDKLASSPDVKTSI